MRSLSPPDPVRFALNHVLGSASSVRLLRILSTADTPVSVTRLAQTSALTPQGTRLTLDLLVAAQVVRQFGAARSRLFSLNPEHPFASALQQLFGQERARWERLTQALRLLVQKDKSVLAAWHCAAQGDVHRPAEGVAIDQRAGEGADMRQHPDRLTLTIVVERDPPDRVLARLRSPVAALEAALSVSCQARGYTLADLHKVAADPPWWSALTQEAVILKGLAPALLLRAKAQVQVGLFAPDA